MAELTNQFGTRTQLQWLSFSLILLLKSLLICIHLWLITKMYLKVIILCKSQIALLCLSLNYPLNESTYPIIIVIELLLPNRYCVVNNFLFFKNILLTEKSFFFLKRCPVKFEYMGFLDIVIYDANNSVI